MYGGNAYGWAYYGDTSQAGAITPPVANVKGYAKASDVAKNGAKSSNS